MGRRAQLMAVIDKAMEHAQKAQRDSESGQHGLFGVFQQEEEQQRNDKLPDIPDWDEHTRLAAEKEILGFFITGHPLEKYRDKLDALRALSTADIAAMKYSTGEGRKHLDCRNYYGSAGSEIQDAAIFTLRLLLKIWLGTVEMIVFPEAYRKLQEKVKLEVPVLIRGGLRIEEGANPKLTVNDIIPLEDAKVPLPRSLRIRIPLEAANESTVDDLHSLFSDRKGEAKVLFDVERQGDFMVVMEAGGYNVQPDRNFISRVEELCGRGAVRIID